jgi:hypothetical protein
MRQALTQILIIEPTISVHEDLVGYEAGISEMLHSTSDDPQTVPLILDKCSVPRQRKYRSYFPASINKSHSLRSLTRTIFRVK